MQAAICLTSPSTIQSALLLNICTDPPFPASILALLLPAFPAIPQQEQGLPQKLLSLQTLQVVVTLWVAILLAKVFKVSGDSVTLARTRLPIVPALIKADSRKAPAVQPKSCLGASLRIRCVVIAPSDPRKVIFNSILLPLGAAPTPQPRGYPALLGSATGVLCITEEQRIKLNVIVGLQEANGPTEELGEWQDRAEWPSMWPVAPLLWLFMAVTIWLAQLIVKKSARGLLLL